MTGKYIYFFSSLSFFGELMEEGSIVENVYATSSNQSKNSIDPS